MSPSPTQGVTPRMLNIDRIFNASPEKLWSYWVDPKKFAKWFNPAGIDLVIHEFDARPGGKVRFDMPQPDGNANPQEGVFHELRPHTEIVQGSPDKSFLIRVRFIPAGSLTRMVVEVTGVPLDWQARATVGWNQGFDHLEKMLGLPPAMPKVSGPNQGFTIERILKGPPERVWGMFTTKEGLEKWWVSADFVTKVLTIDVRVGGKYDIEASRPGQTIHNRGTYTEVVPLRRLAYLWHFDIFLAPGEKPYDIPISIDFEPVPGGTKVRFYEGPLATAQHTEGSRQGVLKNFDRLEAVMRA
ncbi:MAG: SRPBCC family protein [Thermoplasmatota archaeon]